MNIQQDDGDKIEEMPEMESIKSHENPVGPMDIETFDFLMGDKDYSANNPRKSLRIKQENINKPPKNTDFNNDNQNDTENFKYLPTSAINTNKVISNKTQNNSSLSHSQDIKQKSIDLETKTKENIEQLNQNALTSKISFFKRGPLEATFLDKNKTHVNNPTVKNKNNDKVGTDDINITIKIGNISTNISIKKKENDVKLKINNNRKVQTSLDNCNNKDEHNMQSSENNPNTQHVETSTNNIFVKEYKDVAVCTEHSIPKVQLEKSLSTKTSAEASTVQFEITESEEREFADHMDNIPHLIKKLDNELSKLKCTSKSKLQLALDATLSDIKIFDDSNVSDSESVKEDNIQQIKPAKNTPSLKLMSTVKGKPTSQKNINKRSYVSDTEDTSNTKKIKKSQESFEASNVFSLSDMEGNSKILKITNHKPLRQTQQLEVKSLAPEGGYDRATENKENLASQNNMDLVEICTPIQDDDDKSIVEETSQKTTSFFKNRVKKQTKTPNEDEAAAQCSSAINDESSTDARDPRKHPDKDDSVNVISVSDSADESTEGQKSVTPLMSSSTPLAKRSLDMSRRSAADDPEETLCPSSVVAAKTTQEREFMSEAFEWSQSPATADTAGTAGAACVAGSRLAHAELAALKELCARRGWTYTDKYTTELTHLVVAVNEENQSQRTVKYICAVAGSKWIVSFAWAEKCLQVNGFVDEEPYEVLDSSGKPGPRRARLARTKLLHGITFYYMPPFNIIDRQSLKGILEAAGGRALSVSSGLQEYAAPAMLLAETEITQDCRFLINLAMESRIVPMKLEWVVNCLGTYTLKPIFDMLLCPAALLTNIVSNWPSELISSCDE